MKLNERQVEIITKLYILNQDLAEGTDDQRRELTKKIAQQINYEYGPRWGTKASSPTNPQSKDAITYREDGNKLVAWDWQNGDTRKPQIVIGQEGEDITGQYFISVIAFDWLGNIRSGDPESDLSNLEVKVKNLEEQLTNILVKTSDMEMLINGLIEDVADLEAKLRTDIAMKGDKVTVSGKLFGFSVISHGSIDQ